MTSKISTLEVKTFSFNEKETPEDPRRRKQAHKRALNPERSNFRVKTYSFNEEEASEGPGRRPDFQVKNNA